MGYLLQQHPLVAGFGLLGQLQIGKLLIHPQQAAAVLVHVLGQLIRLFPGFILFLP